MDIYKLNYGHYKTSFYKCLNVVKMNFLNEWNLWNYKLWSYKWNFISNRFIKFIKLSKEWILDK